MTGLLGPPSDAPYFSSARKADGSTSGSSISVEVVAIPPLNMASNTALPTARTNLATSTISNHKKKRKKRFRHTVTRVIF